MLKIALALVLSLGFVAAAGAETLGECVWNQVTPADKQAILSGYKVSMNDGAAALQSRDDKMRAAVATCSKRGDVPTPLAQGLVGSQAIQASAADALSVAKGIPRERLDATWRDAPEAARQCTRANAAKVYGLKNEPCPDPKAPIWFLERLNVSPTTDRASAVQALYYFNAKAQTEWAEAFMVKFEQSPKPQ